MSNWKRFLDPDRDWRSRDKLQHAVFGAVLCALFNSVMGLPLAYFWTLWSALVYEAGQADTAHSLGKLGEAGYGFGLLDVGAALAGAAAYVLAVWLS